jgi:protein-disulfide isomerase
MDKDDLRKRIVCNMYNNRFVCFFVVFVSFLTQATVMTLTPVSLVSNQNTENFVFAQTGNDLALSGLVSQGSPYYGNKSAPIVIVDYSDFQCHLCKRHVDNT